MPSDGLVKVNDRHVGTAVCCTKQGLDVFTIDPKLAFFVGVGIDNYVRSEVEHVIPLKAGGDGLHRLRDAAS